MTPNRVNRTLKAYWTTKENRQKHKHLLHFLGPWQHYPEMAANGVGCAFPTNQHLANILGKTDLHSEKYNVFTFWIPDSQISRFLDFQISRFKAVSQTEPAHSPVVAPPWLWTTKLVDKTWVQENPISASPV